MRVHFLGWDDAFLNSLHKYILNRHQVEDTLDLSDLNFVFPTARAGRELHSRLSSHHRDTLLPPTILTLGSLAETTLEFKNPVAEKELCFLKWMEALSKVRMHSVFPQASASSAFIRSAAKTLFDLHATLCASKLSFEDVAIYLKRNGIGGEKRWHEMEKIKSGYIESLNAINLVDPFQEAIDALQANRFKSPQTIYLCSCYDITPFMRELLLSLPEGSDVVALVFAPDSHSLGFCDDGAIKPEYWATQKLLLSNAQITYCDSTIQVSQNCANACQKLLGSENKEEEISIGLLDESILDSFVTNFQSHNIKLNHGAGKKLSTTQCFQLIYKLRQVLSKPTFKHYAAFVRHPWILKSLSYTSEEFLPKLDQIHLQNMPLDWDRDDQFTEVKNLLEPFTASQASHSLETRMETFLVDLPLDNETHALESLRALIRIVVQAYPQASTIEHLDNILFLADGLRFNEANDHSALNVIGWLEMALDATPAVFVLGMNDEIVPSMSESTPFLNTTLKKALGIPCSDTRLGRDSFLFATMLHSKTLLHIFVPKKSSKNDPLAISRLLLRDSIEIISQRVIGFYGESASLLDQAPSDNHELFELPEPDSSIEVKSIKVSSFADYVACPYMFYLKHILKLQREGDEENELSPRIFGTLAHAILEHLPLDALPSKEEIEAVITKSFNTEVGKRFNGNTLPAVWIQLELLKQRLNYFADWQIEQFNQGWRIQAKEHVFKDRDLELSLSNGNSISIRGVVDRIDFNQRSLAWRIVDYKTSEMRQSVSSAYNKRTNTWNDLQLPLYAEYAIRCIPGVKQAFNANKLEIAYVNISKDFTNSPCDSFTLTQDMHSAALAQATELSENIKQNIFGPPRMENWKWELQDLLPEDQFDGRR